MTSTRGPQNFAMPHDNVLASRLDKRSNVLAMIPQDLLAVASDLEGLIAFINRRLREVEQFDLAQFFEHLSDEDSRREFAVEKSEAEDAIGWALRALCERLLLYCEALGLPSTRSAVQAWRDKWADDALGKTKQWHNSQDDGRECPAFSAIRPLLDGLLVLLRPQHPTPPLDPIERLGLEKLEHCLRSLAKVIREREIVPRGELDIQAVMHSHLEGVFEDYTRQVTVAKPLLSFKPDGGVISLRAAIECKFVAKKEELAVAMHGLNEDLSGYCGSRDWTSFYTLIYMTDAYTTERHVARALSMSGGGAWTAILVTGTGVRPVRKRRGLQKVPSGSVP